MTEEDKKALTLMLGKLYITANSSPENLAKVNELVIEAIDGKIASEAASRTALNKLHLAVSKAIGEAGKGRRAVVEEVAEPEVAPEDGAVEITKIGEAVEATGVRDENLTIGGADMTEEVTKDSILDELLDEEDDV